MNLVETHAHIYLDQFKEDIEEVLERSKESGISKIIMPNIDQTSIDGMMELEDKHPNYCYSTIGLHPCSVKEDYKEELKIIEDWLAKRDFVAIGEIGTDLYWDKTFWNQQQEAFNIQCAWAAERDLPVIIHCRESIDETIQLVDQMNDTPTGIFHCFTGNIEQARQIIDLGFKLGIGGVATFKKGGLEPVLEEIDLEHLVLETDSPYLAPTPHRGKRNEPSYLKLILDKIATCKNIKPIEVAEATTHNAFSIFGLPHED